MTTTAITGPLHPLVKYLRQAAVERRHALNTHGHMAKEILRHQHWNTASDQGVYEITGPSRWRYVGTAEDKGHLADQPDYVATTARGGYEALALALAGFRAHRQERAILLNDAAWQATPMIAATLGVRLATGDLTWDTGESVSDAALRLARDAAWKMLDSPNPVFPRAGDVYAEVAEWLGYGGDADELVRHAAAANVPDRRGATRMALAREYLAHRETIAAALAGTGIEWGGERLSGRQAAARAGLADSTWRAHVSPGAAPAADGDGAWPAAVVDAWLNSRARYHQNAPIW